MWGITRFKVPGNLKICKPGSRGTSDGFKNKIHQSWHTKAPMKWMNMQRITGKAWGFAFFRRTCIQILVVAQEQAKFGLKPLKLILPKCRQLKSELDKRRSASFLWALFLFFLYHTATHSFVRFCVPSLHPVFERLPWIRSSTLFLNILQFL